MNKDEQDAGSCGPVDDSAESGSKRKEVLNFRTLLERFYSGYLWGKMESEELMVDPGSKEPADQ